MVDSSRCNTFRANFNSGHMWDQRNNGDHLQYLACHETGHTVGLVHGEFTYDPRQSNNASALECIKTETQTPSEAKSLGSRQAAEINSAY